LKGSIWGIRGKRSGERGGGNQRREVEGVRIIGISIWGGSARKFLDGKGSQEKVTEQKGLKSDFFYW